MARYKLITANITIYKKSNQLNSRKSLAGTIAPNPAGITKNTINLDIPLYTDDGLDENAINASNAVLERICEYPIKKLRLSTIIRKDKNIITAKIFRTINNPTDCTDITEAITNAIIPVTISPIADGSV